MSDDTIAKNLLPETFVGEVRNQSLKTFLAAYGQAAFMLVEIGDREHELEAGLFATVEEAGIARPRGDDGLGFHTKKTSSRPPSDVQEASPPPSADPTVVEGLRAKVRDKRHFIVPLRSREPAGAPSVRVTVGRARSMDIVLRHSSVSKFHGWFENDKNAKTLFAADAGSKNGTTVNGRRVDARRLVRLRPGDVVRFGTVTLRYCLAESLGKLLMGE